MSKKRVIIVHGWGGLPKEPMHAWIRKELRARGFSVTEPRMPHPERPTIRDWTAHLAKNVRAPDASTYFIGHSVGAQTILRYLEKLPVDAKIGGVFSIAG